MDWFSRKPSKRRQPAVPREQRRLAAELAELQDTLAEREQELTEARATIRLRDLEIHQLENIIARDRARVLAETAIAANRHANAVGTLPQDVPLTDESFHDEP